MSFKIMVLESDPGAADQAIHDLTGAGHVALRCHDRDAPAFPCRGVADQSTCPLRSEVVDVALVVRAHPRSEPGREQDGARCALLHRVPLVVAGPAVLDPYADFEARTVEHPGALVEVCEDVAAAPLERHSQIATQALRASRAPTPSLARARAVVTRRDGRLLLTLTGLGDLERAEREAATIRVVAKVREYDASARGFDVVLGEEHDSGTPGSE